MENKASGETRRAVAEEVEQPWEAAGAAEGGDRSYRLTRWRAMPPPATTETTKAQATPGGAAP